MLVTVVHHAPSCRPLSHGVIWPAADLQSFPQFGRFSARSSRINPRVSGRWAEAGVCDLLTLTPPRLRGQQVRAASDCNTWKHQELKENKHTDPPRLKVDGPSDERKRTAFIGRTTRCRWGRAGGSDQDNQDVRTMTSKGKTKLNRKESNRITRFHKQKGKVDPDHRWKQNLSQTEFRLHSFKKCSSHTSQSF